MKIKEFKSMGNADSEDIDIVNQIALAVIEDDLDSIHKFTAVLVEIQHENHCYSFDEGDFYDEVEYPYNLEVSPVDYMSLVIPALLKTVEEEAEEGKWDYNEFSTLLELETMLINDEYQNELLSSLTAIVEPHRAEWLRVYKGEK